MRKLSDNGKSRKTFVFLSIDRQTLEIFSIYGRDDGANFLDQSQREIMLNPIKSQIIRN